MIVSREDILRPRNQKFAIGDLVRVCRERPDFMVPHFAEITVGSLWRVKGTYSQLCGYPNDRHDSEYSLVNAETGKSISWIPEDLLELADE